LDLPASELARWQIYFGINLFPQDRTEYMLAQLSALIFNANFADTKTKAKGPEEFLPKIQEAPTGEPVKNLRTKLAMLKKTIMR
jgi:hypothetical protein